MTALLPPELTETIQEISLNTANVIDQLFRQRHTHADIQAEIRAALKKAYPLIAAHVAKRAAEICRRVGDESHCGLNHTIADTCAEAIERELIGGKDEQENKV